MIKKTVLIVDDDPLQCKLFGRFIENMGHNCMVINNGMEAIDFFLKGKIIDGISFKKIDAVLLDLTMPDVDGLTVLKQIVPVKGDVQVIVLTANRDISLAINAINSGALDYIVKGEKDIVARVTASITNALEKKSLKYQISSLVRKTKDKVSFLDISGQSPGILEAIKLAKKISNSLSPVLIEGEEGCGKEMLAKAMHSSGMRSTKPFVIVSCDNLDSKSAEEIIFGLEVESSSDYFTTKILGKLREANGGTIFFDRIELLPTSVQVRFLNFMQTGEFIPVGAKVSTRADARVICSSNEDLKKLVEVKKFREDLRYKISTFTIYMPSLRERGNKDIKLLAENFCDDFSVSENKKIKSIDPQAMQLLYNYDWKDNIRQLRNIIFQAVILCDSDCLKPEHFPSLLSKKDHILSKVKYEIKKNLGLNSELFDIYDDEGKCKTIEAIEEEIVQRLSDIYSENLTEVSKQLGVGRSTLYRRKKDGADGA